MMSLVLTCFCLHHATGFTTGTSDSSPQSLLRREQHDVVLPGLMRNLSLSLPLSAKEQDLEEKSTEKAQTAAKPEAKPEAKADAEPEAKPQEKTSAAAKAEAKADAKAEAKADAKPDAKPEAKPEAKADAKPEAKPDAKADAKPKAKPQEKTSTAARPEAKAEAKAEAKPAAKAEAKADTKPDAEPEAKADAKPEAKPQEKTSTAAKPEAKADAKPEAKPQEKSTLATAAKPDVKPDVKPEAKPAAKADAKPQASTATVRMIGKREDIRPCNLHLVDDEQVTWQLENRTAHGVSCKLKLLERAAAQQCLRGRNIAFVGDSQLRDFALAVGRFIFGTGTKDGNSADTCVQKIAELGKSLVSVKAGKAQLLVSSLPENLDVQSSAGSDWHVDIYHHDFLYQADWPAAQEIVRGNGLRTYDLIFVNIGLHSHAQWEAKPEGMNIYQTEFLEPMVDLVQSTKNGSGPTPTVMWLPMNRECAAHVPVEFPNQAAGVEMANDHALSYLAANAVPFVNIKGLVPPSQVCRLMDPACGGPHARQWVDLVRAQALLGSFCNDDGHLSWRWKKGSFDIESAS